MAAMATGSPRRVLGDRDVNKLVASPSKKREETSTKVTSLLSPQMESSSRSPAGTPSKKRNAEVLDEGVQQFGRKRAAVEDPNARTSVDFEMDAEDVSTSHNDVEEEATSSQSTPRGSVSPADTSFDDSQNTVITEPEDLALFPAPVLQSVLFPTAAPPRAITKQEARTNAEALRLRLGFAMYKVRTNQTDIPLSQLQLRCPPSPRSNPLDPRTRTALPSSRLSEQTLPSLKPSRSDGKGDGMEVVDIPSSPPPTLKVGTKELATPRLPRSRDGYLNPLESPEKGLTSSVVKGRAADGLLSLMGRR